MTKEELLERAVWWRNKQKENYEIKCEINELHRDIDNKNLIRAAIISEMHERLMKKVKATADDVLTAIEIVRDLGGVCNIGDMCRLFGFDEQSVIEEWQNLMRGQSLEEAITCTTTTTSFPQKEEEVAEVNENVSEICEIMGNGASAKPYECDYSAGRWEKAMKFQK